MLIYQQRSRILVDPVISLMMVTGVKIHSQQIPCTFYGPRTLTTVHFTISIILFLIIIGHPGFSTILIAIKVFCSRQISQILDIIMMLTEARAIRPFLVGEGLPHPQKEKVH